MPLETMTLGADCGWYRGCTEQTLAGVLVFWGMSDKYRLSVGSKNLLTSLSLEPPSHESRDGMDPGFLATIREENLDPQTISLSRLLAARTGNAMYCPKRVVSFLLFILLQCCLLLISSVVEALCRH